MAERRMFTQKITEADNFTALPPTTQCLYFHLCMSADDDGFSNKIRQSMFNAHADQNDFELLVKKRFIIPFDSGVIVIKHWRMHNLIRSDRYHETDYIEEKATLLLKENGVYTDRLPDDNQKETIGIPCDNQTTTGVLPNDNQMEPEVRLGKYSNNNINVQNDAEEMFLRVWKLYPYKKTGKDSVKLATKKKLFTDVGEEQLLRCLERFKQDMNGKDPQYVVRASTFFNTRYVDYLDENYKETMGIIDDDSNPNNSKQLRRELQ